MKWQSVERSNALQMDSPVRSINVAVSQMFSVPVLFRGKEDLSEGNERGVVSRVFCSYHGILPLQTWIRPSASSLNAIYRPLIGMEW